MFQSSVEKIPTSWYFSMVTNPNFLWWIVGENKNLLDVVVEGALMGNGETKSFALIDDMTSNSCQ